MVRQGLKVLVIDDSETDAQTLSYLLIKRLGCQVEIANNGLDGLNKLADGGIEVVFLDLTMPIVDGIEVLREIRECEQTAHLPVVIISATTDPKKVSSVIELKLFDYVIKPYNAEKLVKRFSEKFADLRARRVVPVSMQLPGDETLRESGKEIILVVDDDSNFRHFFASTLGSRFHVVEASNGAQAIALAMRYCPAHVFAGSAIGVFGRDRMAKKLRILPQLADLKVYAVDKDGEASPGQDAIFNGRVKRTFVASAFLESVDHCLSGANGASTKAPATPLVSEIHQAVISATEQVFGMMMSTEVSLDPLDTEFAATQDCNIRGGIDFFGYQEGKRIAINVFCDHACINAMAKRMLQMETAEVENSLELAENSLAEVLNMIGGRVNQYLGEQHRVFFLGLPSVNAQGPAESKPLVAKEFGAYFSFEGGHRFYLTMGRESLTAGTISSENLTEGMVLADSVDLGRGSLLSKGQRLDANMIAEIRVGGADKVEVFDDSKYRQPA